MVRRGEASDRSNGSRVALPLLSNWKAASLALLGEPERGDAHAKAPDGLAGIDSLIDVRRQAAEAWAKRLDGIEGRATAIGTAAITLSAALVGLSSKIPESQQDEARGAFLLLVLVVAISVIGRVYPRHRLGKRVGAVRDRLRGGGRTEAQQRFDKADDRLLAFARRLDQENQQGGVDAPPDDRTIRLAVLDYWTMREDSSHRAYDAKAAWTGAAAVTFLAALAVLAVAGFGIL